MPLKRSQIVPLVVGFLLARGPARAGAAGRPGTEGCKPSGYLAASFDCGNQQRQRGYGPCLDSKAVSGASP